MQVKHANPQTQTGLFFSSRLDALKLLCSLRLCAKETGTVCICEHVSPVHDTLLLGQHLRMGLSLKPNCNKSQDLTGLETFLSPFLWKLVGP